VGILVYCQFDPCSVQSLGRFHKKIVESGPTCEKYPQPVCRCWLRLRMLALAAATTLLSLATVWWRTEAPVTVTRHLLSPSVTCCHAIRFTTGVSLLVRSHRSKNTSVHYIPEQIRQPLNCMMSMTATTVGYRFMCSRLSDIFGAFHHQLLRNAAGVYWIDLSVVSCTAKYSKRLVKKQTEYSEFNLRNFSYITDIVFLIKQQVNYCYTERLNRVKK